MDISEFAKQFPEKMKQAENFIKTDAKDIIGTEAVEHFRESFANQGFTDKSLEKWPQVERRKPKSDWYGHSGETGKFSQARTTAKILTGETGNLANATTYTLTQQGVKVVNAMVYAAVHNFGQAAKIYGKKSFKMLARPFIGKSVVMKHNIENELAQRIIKIIK